MKQKFMYQVFQKAREGIWNGQSPFAACIVKDDKIVSCSNNTVYEEMDILAHAEMNVIKEAAKKFKTMDLSGCELYCSCEPCPMCFSACHWAKISTIVSSTRIEDSIKYGFNELPISNEKMIELSKSNIVIYKDILRNQGLELYIEWKEYQNTH